MHICLADDSVLYIQFLFHIINKNVSLLVVEQTNSKEEISTEMRKN